MNKKTNNKIKFFSFQDGTTKKGLLNAIKNKKVIIDDPIACYGDHYLDGSYVTPNNHKDYIALVNHFIENSLKRTYSQTGKKKALAKIKTDEARFWLTIMTANDLDTEIFNEKTDGIAFNKSSMIITKRKDKYAIWPCIAIDRNKKNLNTEYKLLAKDIYAKEMENNCLKLQQWLCDIDMAIGESLKTKE